MKYLVLKYLVLKCLFLLSLFGTFAWAQNAPQAAGTHLPLVTAGTVLRWAPDGDEVVFELPQSSWVKLSVYSPNIDLDEPGDEHYDAAPLEAAFTLSRGGPDTVATLRSERFSLGASRWLTFFEGPAAAGSYTLRSEVAGNGKNVYLLKLETELADVTLQAESVTVNVSSEAWTDAFSFDIAGHRACALELYDGDGRGELSARLRLPSGTLQPVTLQPVTLQLAVSGDRASVSQALPRLPGLYTVQLALPAGRYQKTNAVRFVVRCGGAAQRVTLTPATQLVAPLKPVELPTLEVTVTPKRPLPLPVPSAAVTPKRPVELPQVVASVSPQPKLEFTRTLSSELLAPCQTLTVTLSVTNGGAAAGNYLLREALPEGLQLVAQEGATVLGNDLVWQGSLEPGATTAVSYTVTLTPAAPPLATLRGVLDGTGLERVAEDTVTRADFTTEVTPPAGPVYVGEETTLHFTVTNPLPVPVTVGLGVQGSGRSEVVDAPRTLTLPAAASATANLTVRGVVEGTGLLEVTPYCDSVGFEGVPAGSSGLLQLKVATLPELPQPRQTTTVVVDVAAYDLPVLDGLVLVERLPAGASYVAGSATVNGRVAADPQGVDDALVFELPGTAVGQVSFTVLHEGLLGLGKDHSSLIGLTPEPEVLLGSEDALELYTRAETLGAEASASGPATNMVARERVGAVILAPAPGLVLRERDRVTVSTDTPLNSEVTLTVNGEPVAADTVGRRVFDPNLNRQTYDFVGVPLQPGPNEVRLESALDGEVVSDSVTVYFSGPAAGFTLTPLTPLVADSATPLALDLVVTDVWGNATLDGFVTLEVEGARLAAEDAAAEEVGFQLRSENGHARLKLESLAEPTEVVVRVLVGETFQSQTVKVTSNLRPWLVSGTGSVGAAYGEGFEFGVGGSFFARGRVLGDYLLTLAARYPFADLGPADSNPYQAFPVPGSSGAASYGAESRQGVYARLERDESYLQYGDFTPPLSGFLDLGRFYTGLSGVYVGTHEGVGFGVRAYAAFNGVTDMRVVDLKSDGTSLRFVPNAPVEPNTLRVEVVKKDGLGVSVPEDDLDPVTRVLVPLKDFRINEETGLLELFKPVPLIDARGDAYYLRLSYTLAAGNAARYLQAGAQAEVGLGGAKFRLGVAQETSSDLSYNRVVAGGASYEASGVRADAEVAYGVSESSGGVAVTTRLLYSADALNAEAGWRFVSAGYRSPTALGAAGHTLEAAASYAFSSAFSVAARTSLSAAAGNTDLSADALGLYRGEGFDLQFGANLEGGLLRPLVGGNLYDLFGWQGSRLGVVHRQGLGADARSVTQFSAAFPLLEFLSLTLSDELVWGDGNALLLGLEATLQHDRVRASLCRTLNCADPSRALGNLSGGSTTVTAQYELPGGVSAAAGRVRLGLDTTLPLSETLSLQFGAEYRRGLSSADGVQGDAQKDTQVAVRAGANYDTDDLDAALRYEVSWNPAASKHVIVGGSTFALSDRLYGSVTGTYLYDSAQGSGASFGVAGAYRGERLVLLTNNEARFGALSREGGVRGGTGQGDTGRGNIGRGDSVWGDTRATWTLGERYDLRFGYAYRYLVGESYLDLVNVGGGFYAWQGGNVLVQARLFNDWTAQERAFGVGLEVSQRLGCGVYGVAGYNLGGLDRDYGAVYGGSGVFVRLDAVFDEQWTCGRAAPTGGGN